MTAQTRESRPGGDRAAISDVVLPGGLNAAILPTAPDAGHDDVPLGYGLLVTTATTNGYVRRAVVLSVRAAERRQSAAAARGCSCTVRLVALAPVAAVIADQRSLVPAEVRRDESGALVPNVLPEGVTSW